MYGYGNSLKSEGTIKYSSQFCNACLTPNRNLTMVGRYVDIYRKFCDNGATSQVVLCWECMTMIKKIAEFKKKVQYAQKILNYRLNHAVLLSGLTSLIQSPTETVKYPEDDEDQDDTDQDEEKVMEDLTIQIQDVRGHYKVETLDAESTFNSSSGLDAIVEIEEEGSREEEMRKEEERRREEEMREEERRREDEVDYRCWKRAVMLVLKRICGHRYAQHFLKPVRDEVAPLYSKVIRRPTDLGTIKKKIKDGSIRTTEQLKRELLLMFSNALMYNSSRHGMFHMAFVMREDTLCELSLLSAAQSESTQPPPLRPRRASTFRDLSPSVPSESPQCANPRSPTPARHAPRRRRASTCTACDDDVTVAKTTNGESKPVPERPAATVRRRRASEWSGPSPTPAPAPAPTWNWMTLDLHSDFEFLEPRHWGKECKAVL